MAIKPTKEELEKGIAESIEKAEKLPDEDPIDKEEEESEEDIEDIESEEDQEEKEDEEESEGDESEDSEESEEDEEKEDDKGEEDHEEDSEEEKEDEEPETTKKKLKASSQEAIALHAKNKRINEAIDKAKDQPEPTEEDLRAEYPDYDEMTPTEQRFASDNLKNKRFRDAIEEARAEGRDVEKWIKKVTDFVEDPATLTKFPELEGKTDDFKSFSNKQSRRGVPLEDLVGAFLFDLSKTGKIKHKGKMFEVGSGGSNNKGKSQDKTLSPEEGRRLMKTNYPKYKTLLKAGKIRNY